jgi:hypothetical protein
MQIPVVHILMAAGRSTLVRMLLVGLMCGQALGQGPSAGTGEATAAESLHCVSVSFQDFDSQTGAAFPGLLRICQHITS